MHPTISVIIPVYNRERYVRATIDSALAQGIRPHQIIVVDDGSTDRSLSIVESFGNAVEVYRQENEGCAAARNLAIEHSTGEYLAFLDSDDVWYPWTLRLVAEAIEQHDKPPVLSTASLNFEGDAPPELKEQGPLHVRVHRDILSARRVVGTCVLVVRRDVAVSAGGFVPINMNGTDAEFNLRIGTIGPFVELLGPPMLGYRRHPTNVMKNLDGTFRGLCYMIEQEREGNYPGGSERRRDRIQFIAAAGRPQSILALRSGRVDLAGKFFWGTFKWNLQLGRIRYLLGFPVLGLFHSAKRKLRLGES